jgi:2-amino-4-hydroxy-6-hydroxymethyldihydropteridine diphosphokinase
MPVCLIAVGSNEGDGRSRIQRALSEVEHLPHCRLVRSSSLFETEPVGPASAPFLNGCFLVETSRPPEQLVNDLLDIEAAGGRLRPTTGSVDRPIDLDLLLYDDQTLSTEHAVIPHPRMSFRRFVLEPAVQIAPAMHHPLFDATLGELLARISLPSRQIVVALPDTELALAETVPRKTFGWSVEFVHRAPFDVGFNDSLDDANLLIETCLTPPSRETLWHLAYRGPRWHIGPVATADFSPVLAERIQTAIQSMNPLP